MNINWEESGPTGICFMEEGKSRIVAVHYTWSSEDLMILDHVEIAYPDARNLLTQVLGHIVENARMLGTRVIPLSDMLTEIFANTPAYADVLYLKEKARGGVIFPGNPIRTRELFG